MHFIEDKRGWEISNMIVKQNAYLINKTKAEHIASVVKGVDVSKTNSSEGLVGKIAPIVFDLHLRLTYFLFMFVFPQLKKYYDYNQVVNFANAALEDQFQMFNLRLFLA